VIGHICRHECQKNIAAQRYSYRVREKGKRGYTLDEQGTEPTPSNPIISVNPVMEQANLVRIGKKPIMNYVVACVTLFNSGAEEVMVRARGQAITKAVETVLMLQNSFIKDLEIGEIRIGSEEVTRLDGTRGSISTIEIMLEKY
jgi:DNA-binding protein